MSDSYWSEAEIAAATTSWLGGRRIMASDDERAFARQRVMRMLEEVRKVRQASDGEV